jgi:RNA polymerase sigma-70 factor, ECF subfamily
MGGQPERGTSETELLALAQRGDLVAFERLVEIHHRRIFALALRITGDPEDAKDAAQETFIRLHGSLRQIESGRSLGPWLYTVAVNACRDIARKRQRSRLIPMDEFVSAGAHDPAMGPESLYSDRELERQLQTALRKLPEKERAALLLREMEGLSTAEVAEVLGSSEATVRSQICCARMKLRRLFGRRERKS